MTSAASEALARLGGVVDRHIAPLDLTGLAAGPIAIAVSGGSDSLALLLAGSVWARARQRSVLVLTVDHGLRAGSAGEAASVAALAARLGHPHQTLRWDRPPGLSPSQAHARSARYRLLGAAMQAAGAKVLMTGHTADDQAETILMRATRRTPLTSLAGIRAVSPMPVWPEGRDIVLLRPFLGERRATLREMLAAQGVVWSDDPSNADERYERVRLRALMSASAPLHTHATRIGDAARRLRAVHDRALSRLMRLMPVDAGGVIRLPAGPWTQLAAAVRTRAVTHAIALAAGSDRPVRAAAAAGLADSLLYGDRAPTSLGGALIWRTGDTIHLARDPATAPGPRGEIEAGTLIWDGRYELEFAPGHGPARYGRLDPQRPMPARLRERLRELPGSARASQLALFDKHGEVSSLPVLSPETGIRVRDLVAQRHSLIRRLLDIEMNM